MKVMNRNKQTVWYALFTEREETTSGYRNKYADPVKIRAVVSANTGNTEGDDFGSDVDYSRIITTDDTSCPIDEYSLICIQDAEPENSKSGYMKADYIVTRVAKDLNVIRIAVKKVDVR